MSLTTLKIGTKSRGIYAKVDPTTPLNVPYVKTDGTDKLALVTYGEVSAEQCGIYTTNTGAQNRDALVAAYSNTYIKAVVFNNPQGGAYPFVGDGSNNIVLPFDFVIKFMKGCKITGTFNMHYGIYDAPFDAQIFDVSVMLYNFKLAKNVFSACWFGAIGDDYTNCTAAVNHTDLVVSNKMPIYFPKAQAYRMDNPLFHSEVRGDGGGGTIFKRYTQDGGFICSVGHHAADETALKPFIDVSFDGESGVNNGTDFNNGHTSDSDDSFAGHWHFKNVRWANCKRSVQKVFGNFGNVFDGCNFISANYLSDFHYYAVSLGSTMHCGLDTFNDCRFAGAYYSNVYIDDQEGGGHSFHKCVFEANRGFAVFINQYGVNGQILPLIFESCWLEQYATWQTTAINGITYTEAYDYYFKNTRSVTLRNCAIGRIFAEASIVRLDGCQHQYIYGTKIDWDLTSIVTEDNASGWQTDSPALSNRVSTANATNFGVVMRTELPAIVTNQYKANLILDNPLEGLSDFNAQSGNFTGTTVSDPTVNKTVLELSSFTGDDFSQNCTITIPANKYFVVGLGIKKISGAVAVVQDESSNIYYFAVKQDGWQYCWRMGYVTTTTTVKMLVPNNGAGYRITSFQALQFDNPMDAQRFLRSNIYVTTRDVENKIQILNSVSDFNSIPYPRTRYIYRIFSGGDWQYDSTDTTSSAVAGQIYVAGSFRFKSLSYTAGALQLPSGTTSQRPGSPVVGMVRYNTDTPGYERWNGTAWEAWATGGGGTVPTIPAAFETIVTASGGTINAGDTSIYLAAFVGLNVDFLRNRIEQSILQSEYTWTSSTGVLTFPAAVEGEYFKVKPKL